MGKFLAPETISLPPDTYSFDIQVKDNDFEFQFGINESDQNKFIQTKLSNLINRSNIGVTSSVVEDDAGNSSLRLESVSTGISDSKSLSFTVSENKTSKKTGVVEYMGLNEVTSPATNATFTLNGTTHNSASNSFTVDKKFEITLNNITGDQSPITIGLKPDTESMADNIQELVDGYNEFIQNVSNFNDSSLNSDRLLSEMTHLCNSYRNELDSIGLSFDQDGNFSMDRTLLSQSLTEDEAKENLSIIGGFSSSVINKINQISLDPMNYVKKTVVAYKNPGKSLVTPYIASVYSGMMFNYYC
ncbi:MAG: flagellar filament capping protein FliD [Lachnospiraceae bacterium]|nr:flagellar filament capping protein FliD [Lachnospiraceae bacterium]